MSSIINTAAVYFADASELNDDGLYAKLYAAAGQYRRQKTDKYRLRRDKNLSLCAEYLLRCGCGDFGIDLGAQKIALSDCGKPYFEDCELNFNLSHSEERAMCAVSRYELGCDIEKIRSFDTEIAAYSCSREELIALEACKTESEKSLLFYRLWTLKESFIKCTGEGVSTPLKSLCFIKNGEIIRSYCDYFLFDGILDGTYSYALCIHGGTDYESVRNQIKVIKKSAKTYKHLAEESK